MEPIDGTRTVDNTPTFDWSDVTDPSGVTYWIQVNNENTFSSPILIDSSGLTASTYTAPAALPYGTYYWRVKTTDGAGNDSWSSVWSFFIAPPCTGAATFKLENLYNVGLEKDLQINTGSKLVVKFYKYDNVTFQTESVIENIAPPQSVVENENVPHPRAAERYSWGTVQIARLVLTTDNENEVISTIASFTVHQSHLRWRYINILRDWGALPELWDEFRAEIGDILKQWASAPT